jgi:hypothetical protein
MTQGELDAIAEATAEAIKVAVEKSIGPLRDRIAQLEQRPASLKYCGVWGEAERYALNDAVTYGGSLWIARAANSGVTPGSGAGWQLCVKRGRDGKDAR